MVNDTTCQKSNYLLVTLKEFDDELIQRIFEIALKFKLLPLSYNHAKDAFIFEIKDDSADQFRQELLSREMPVTMEDIYYTF